VYNFYVQIGEGIERDFEYNLTKWYERKIEVKVAKGLGADFADNYVLLVPGPCPPPVMSPRSRTPRLGYLFGRNTAVAGETLVDQDYLGTRE